MPYDWMIDEREHAGDEHFDPAEVARFDEKLPFDPDPEVRLLREYGLSNEDTIIDFGTGTGVFPLEVAPYCKHVIAVDVSDTMLETVRQKCESHGVHNIETVHDGFLSYTHTGELASFAFSKDALHHLPDFWKMEALKNIGDALQPGGILRLRDFVFSFDPATSLTTIEEWISAQKEQTQFSEEEIHLHFREECSTYGFLLEEILTRVGFTVLDATYGSKFTAAYTCRWEPTNAPTA